MVKCLDCGFTVAHTTKNQRAHWENWQLCSTCARIKYPEHYKVINGSSTYVGVSKL